MFFKRSSKYLNNCFIVNYHEIRHMLQFYIHTLELREYVQGDLLYGNVGNIPHRA